jgi:hypothetical protein
MMLKNLIPPQQRISRKGIKSVFLLIFVFLASFYFSDASSTGLDVNLHVGGQCNNNGICEAVNGEDIFSCPADCTPVEPPTPPGTGGTSTGGTIGNYFNNLTVSVSYNSVIIKWKSTVPTISSFKWGTNPDYKDGSLQNINFLIDHKVELNNLKDGTVYYFSIQSANYYGISNSLENQTFKTLYLPDITPPGNPTNIKAVSDLSGINLSWDNPKDEDFDYVRIMRNDDRYYASPYLGHLVYEGKAKYFTDVNVKEGKKYFYTFFSRDRAGNYSSGSMISLIHNPKGLDIWGTILTQPEKLEKIEGSFILIQNSSTYDFYPGEVFRLSGDSPITIKTNYLSKIKNDDLWIEVRDKEGMILGQYFFSRTRDKDGFVSVIAPVFDIGGYYNLMIYKYIDGVSSLVNYGSLDITKAREKNTSEWSFLEIILFGIFIFLVILVLVFFIILIKRKILKKIEQNKVEDL